ncbi:MAG TPA: YdcF family protein [Syntrophorhabdaceae bacterium]|nr:YdcF family protein [Syntrophorhabdaceae bacterium]HOL04719.1 YdcF family protein [Syntrophorhabdaceae bacterium]HON85272.1 YdcF family protein [Syntrophorhabdaceae bacterium]HOT42589.1 YdcF family protein [Syntrophorhabdaceae bacterium]HPC66153.1 YdcF family protein [Syntrophorhabdaceae bacterium]
MLFFLKKLITYSIVPPGIIIILLILSAIFLRKRLRFFIIIVALAIYALSIEPVKDIFIIPLEDAYKPPSINDVKSCDAYVVLGGGINENAPGLDGEGQLSNDSLPRVVEAYRLYIRHKRPIILSGGKVYGIKEEAEIAKKFLISLGVDETYIITEGKSRDTHENALFVKEILEKKGVKKAVLITSAFHMKRSVQLFRRYFPQILPYPTGYRTSRSVYTVMSYMPDAGNITYIAYSLKEYMGILFYKIKP